VSTKPDQVRFDAAVDDGRATAFVAKLWEASGLPTTDPFMRAVSALVLHLLADPATVSPMTLAYEFEGRLTEYTLRMPDGRLLMRAVFRSDGTVIEDPMIDEQAKGST
jgi:hypothetical protein